MLLFVLHTPKTLMPRVLAGACRPGYSLPSPSCSAEHTAAQARHVGRADGLEQEILGSFLQAPDENHSCQEAEEKKTAASKETRTA
jgi:hypothetical protein